MKKFASVVCMAFFSGLFLSANAFSEDIPLFDDSFGGSSTAAVPSATDKENKTQNQPESAVNQKNNSSKFDSNMPKLGRNAEPVTNLVVEPIPNLSFGVDLIEKDKKVEVPQVKIQEKETNDADVIRRQESLNITESPNKKNSIWNDKISGVNISDLQRHDVSFYKIAGIGLGDDTETVYDELTDLGYSLQKVEKSIPLYRTTYYNNICREQKGLKILSDINDCILELAETDEVHYVSRETYTRPESHETIQVQYSSPETDNVAYKIIYENKGDNSLNSSRVNLAKKFQRRDDFWDLIFNTYGLPDESDKKLWGDENTRYLRAFMQGSAYNAYVIMEDKIIQDNDYEAAQSDFKTIKKPTAFTLTGEEPEENEE